MRFLFFKKEKELPQSIKEATAKEVKKPLKETILFSIKGTFALFFKKIQHKNPLKLSINNDFSLSITIIIATLKGAR